MQNLLRKVYENFLLLTSVNFWGDYPLINSQRVELPDIKQMRDELIGLERKNTTKPRIDHAPGQHDDMINAVAGVLVFSLQVNNVTTAARLIC